MPWLVTCCSVIATVMPSSSLRKIFGGREAMTGNTSAVRRLAIEGIARKIKTQIHLSVLSSSCIKATDRQLIIKGILLPHDQANWTQSRTVESSGFLVSGATPGLPSALPRWPKTLKTLGTRLKWTAKWTNQMSSRPIGFMGSRVSFPGSTVSGIANLVLIHKSLVTLWKKEWKTPPPFTMEEAFDPPAERVEDIPANQEIPIQNGSDAAAGETGIKWLAFISKSRAPNENIVQNHLNVALLNVF